MVVEVATLHEFAIIDHGGFCLIWGSVLCILLNDFLCIWNPPGLSVLMIVIAFRRTVKQLIQFNIPAENWRRTFKEKVITNAHFETLRDILQSPKARQRNKAQAIKSGGGGVSAECRSGIIHIYKIYIYMIINNVV